MPIFEFGDKPDDTGKGRVAEDILEYNSLDDMDAVIKNLKKQMDDAARDLEFEKAADLRDQIRALQKLIVLEV
jgi:excinuclease ABC subunit B